LAAGNAYIALHNSGARGSVRIEGRHDFIPGHLETVTGTDIGTVTFRTRQINGDAGGSTLTADDTQTWDEWIGRLARK
jgi:hypothetical protein